MMTLDPYILSQVLAALAIGLHAASFQFPKRNTTLSFIMIAMALLSAHFFLLGAMTAAAITGLNVARYATGVITTDQRVMYLFLVLVLVLGYVTYDGPVDLLPIVAGSLGTLAVFRSSSHIMRRYMMGGTVSMLVHNSIIFTPTGILFELFIGASNAVSYWRFYIRKRKADPVSLK